MRRSTKTSAFLAAAALALAACSGGESSGSGQPSAPAAQASPAAPVLVEGDPLPPVPQGQQPEVDAPQLRLTAPALTMSTPDGGLVAVGSGAGRPQVLVFLAHWCPSCQREVPSLVEALSSGLLPPDVELVAVLTAFDPSRPNWPPLEWLQREGLVPSAGSEVSGSVTVVVDDADMTAMRSFGLSAFPGWALTTSEGRVLSRFSGLLSGDSLATVLQLPSGS